MVEPGQRCLGDRYELISLLATGGMGQVWRARDVLLDRAVAVKVLRSEFTGDPTFLARFRAEARHTAVLAHRNIAALHDYGEVPAGGSAPEHLAYLVMELVEGDPLSVLLAREPRLGVERTLDLLQQTAAALGAAHAAGVVHRDVKPGNILVGTDGLVKITDFGIAWSASSVPLTQTGQIVGTASYLSPEQAAGAHAGPASDVYALGMIGYECLAGRRAFDGENPVQIALRHLRDVPAPLPDDVPENVRRLIARALLKDPAARFPDGGAFGGAVADVRAGRMLAPPPAPETRPFRLPDAVPSRRAASFLMPVAALLAGAGIAVAATQLLVAPPSPAASAAGSAPVTVLLQAGNYLGRPVGDVTADLGVLGLGVQVVGQVSPDQAPGTVTGVDPVGAVPVGGRVTVSVAVAPVVAPAPEPPAPTPVAAPVPRPVVVPRALPAPPVPEPVVAQPPAPEPLVQAPVADEGDRNRDGPPSAGPGGGDGDGRGDGRGDGKGDEGGGKGDGRGKKGD